MANLKSSKKDIRRTKARTLKNNSVESAVRTFYKKAKTFLENKSSSKEECLSSIINFEKSGMKAAQKSIIDKKNISRKVSRLISSLKKKFA